ncbi:hypothetical protein AM493_00290 [Flavobacterium akiainvivens]|uniref:Uncharacterized protein n=1 Tax=Flavobacterium akiainvivens TaxID=1202724 RepID=A0A0M8MEL3_9FLAO|nr:hypothetical protein AM493_00290 [Flavobacterium akiainvivens]
MPVLWLLQLFLLRFEPPTENFKYILAQYCHFFTFVGCKKPAPIIFCAAWRLLTVLLHYKQPK